MRNARVIAGMCVSVLFLVSSAGCELLKTGKVLARVNDEVITQDEFQAKIDRLPPYYRVLAREQKGKFLDELINEKLFLKEAYRSGINRNREVKELIKEAHNKIIVAKFIEEEINRSAKISDKDIEDFYNMHKKEFIAPARYKASHILVSSEQQAEEALNRLDKGEDFAAIAKEVSIDPSRTNGGDLGYFTEGQMIPDFESACFRLDVGQTSGIVKTQFGYHIIRLTDKKPAEARTLYEVSNQIRRRILDVKKMERFQDIIKKLRSRARISINEKLLQPEGKDNK